MIEVKIFPNGAEPCKHRAVSPKAAESRHCPNKNLRSQLLRQGRIARHSHKIGNQPSAVKLIYFSDVVHTLPPFFTRIGSLPMFRRKTKENVTEKIKKYLPTQFSALADKNFCNKSGVIPQDIP